MTLNNFQKILLCVLIVSAVVYFHSPLRTIIPNTESDVRLLKQKFDALDEQDRELVMGYILRMRGETPSTFMKDDVVFDAKTFKDAIEAQKLFMDKEGYQTTKSFLKIGLEDQIRKPLRDAVSAEFLSATVHTRREIYNIPSGYSTRFGKGIAEQDKPILVQTYRVTNLTDKLIDNVNGGIEIRQANFNRIKTLGFIGSCILTVENIEPYSYKEVQCYNPNSNELTDQDRLLLSSRKNDLHFIWRPHEVIYSTGERLIFNESDIKKSLLWGFYSLN